MHYITTFESIENIKKKVKPTDNVLVLSEEDSVPVATLNVLMGIKANVAVKPVSDTDDAPAVIGYYIGKYGKNVTVDEGSFSIPEVLREFIEPEKKPAAKKKTPEKKPAPAKEPEKNPEPETEAPEPVREEIPAEPKPVKEEAVMETKEEKSPAADTASVDVSALLAEIASEAGATPEEVKRRILICFRYEDAVKDAKDTIVKEFSEDVWEKIQPVAEQFLNEANAN